MGFIFGGGGGKEQAKAIEKTAKAEAAADREAARGAQLTQETMIAQDRAARAAGELLSRPQGQVEVNLESIDENDALIRGKYSKLTKAGAKPAPASGGSTVIRQPETPSGSKARRKSGLRI